MRDVRATIPGLALVAGAVGVAFLVQRFVDVSPLVVGVVLGMVAVNAGVVRPVFVPGVQVAARRLLRLGIVLLGLRLSFDEVRDLGLSGAVAVVVVVVGSFFGIQLLARSLGLSSGFGLLVATGYSICGASAIAAMEPLSGADEEETAYAIGLVALCGSISIAVFPALGHLMDLGDATFGTWAGAGIHDVGQVTAAASAYSDDALASATLVKLTRVMLLAPMVLGVGLVVRRRLAERRGSTTDGAPTSPTPPTPTERDAESGEAPSVPIVPLFVVGFLAAIALRATGWLTDEQLDAAKQVEQILLTAGMFGLGAGVHVARLRRLGGRPLVLGLVAWVLVATAALGAAVVVT